MSGPLDQPEHATPLTPEEREGLIPSHVTQHGELNELEQQNILKADTWATLRKRDPVGELLVAIFIAGCSAMFGHGQKRIAHQIKILASTGN
jgi:hypothetical protein